MKTSPTNLSKTKIQLWGLAGIPEIEPGTDLCQSIVAALRQNEAVDVLPGTIFVLAQKIVSKAEGRILSLDGVVPSAQALDWAAQHHKDAQMIEVILGETRRVVRMERGILIVETHQGFICANAGVDASNCPRGTVTLLPLDPDDSALRLRRRLEEAFGVPIAVIISDTFGRPWRQGLTNVALGVSGLSPLLDYRGQADSYGQPLQATVLAVADELAAAAELVMGKTLHIPVAVIEGFEYQSREGRGRELIRPAEEDLFR